MPAFVPGAAGALSVKLVSVFARNHERGLPSHQALIALFEPETGRPICVMDGTHITSARTACASALSAKLLAPQNSRVVAIVGAGVQGRAHLDAMAAVFSLDEIRIASRTREHAETLARAHPRARACASFQEAVSGAEIVCVCTDAPEPVLEAEWVRPGAHVTSVGASQHGPELPSDLVRSARLFVESRSVTQRWPVGAHELQGLNPGDVTELGEVLLGTRPGRTTDSETTLYKSVGNAVEDAAAARVVYDAARAEHLGTEISV
jgi:ornithine cyclodeaminase/alanine dehydrogenase-like protein (mu-crystallin family)